MADLITQILKENLPPENSHLLPVLANIIETNRQLGRFPQRTATNNPDGLKSYCLEVYHNYRQHQPLLVQLQVDRDEAAWMQLLPRLYRWAQRILRSKASHLHFISIEEWAQEISHISGQKILHARFSYDVPLDAWLFTILRNVAYNEIRHRLTKQQQYEDKAQQVQDFSEISHLLPAAARSGRNEPWPQGSEISLAELVDRLSPVQRTVIRLHYFEERSLSEISAILDKTPNAIYQAHFAGLRKLRIFLEELRKRQKPH